MGFDTEDDSKGNPLLFTFVHERGSWMTRDAEDARTYLQVIAADCRRRGWKLQAWATNLEYDLVNLFGPEHIARLTLSFGKSFLVGATWRGKNIEFRDTIRHLPASVEELGEMVGLKKRETRLFHSRRGVNMDALQRRGMRDAAITFRFAKLLRTVYRRLGDRPRMTLASTAFNIWKDRFWKRSVEGVLDEVREFAGEAYYGGRTEPFGIGEFPQVRIVDAASMFPWAMVHAPFPVPWGTFERIRGAPGALQETGIYRARIAHDPDLDALGLLPYRTNKGTIFPKGEFSGSWIGAELIRAARAGIKVQVQSGIEFHTFARPFDNYIRALFRRKSRARGGMRSIYKTMLNGLYGKFGEKGERVQALTLEQFTKLRNPPEEFRVWNGLVFFRREQRPPPWGNQVWSAIVTARARVRLYDEMVRIKRAGGRILYCDTDSVMFQGSRLHYPAKAPRPGVFEDRGNFRLAIIRGKKEYALQHEKGWTFHVKGVPFAAREDYIRSGMASFQRPIRLREGARSGEPVNLWRQVEKRRRVDFKDRGQRADGSLEPIILDE